MKAALFDLDGVLIDSESDYDEFWRSVGAKYFPNTPHFSHLIKGNTMDYILERYFSGHTEEERATLLREVDEWERGMSFAYISGVPELLADLRRRNVKMALVTASTRKKLDMVKLKHPDLMDFFEVVVSAEKMTRSKPFPDCYLQAAFELHVPVDECVVFEDSFNGLASGRASKMFVVGLSTTNSIDLIQDKCDVVLPDFLNFNAGDFLRLRKCS